MKELHAEIEIRASPEQIWKLLTDFSSFPQWNPFLRQAAGKLEVGARLDVFIQPPGGRGMRFRPTVLKAVPNHELRWLGRLLFPGLFDGEHTFTIEPAGAGLVRFTQREVFRGLFVPLLGNAFYERTQQGFSEMNGALKIRVEDNLYS